MSTDRPPTWAYGVAVVVVACALAIIIAATVAVIRAIL